MSEETNTGLVPAETGTAIAKASDSSLFLEIDVDNMKDFPDLSGYQVANLELASEYFSSKNVAEGVITRILFIKVENQSLPSRLDKTKLEEVPTAFFYAVNEKGDAVFYQNSTKKFVNSLQDFNAHRGMVFDVLYLGKVTFKNGNEGDNWSVKPVLKKMTVPA